MLNPSLSQNRPALAPARSPRFGLSGAIGRVDTVMTFLEGDRTRQMLVEDFMGFGVLRTVMDLFRGYFFGDQDNKLNVPMAVERLLREVGSILTDNISSGVAAFLLGKYFLDKKGKAYSNHFTSYPALEFFQAHLKNSVQASDFLANIAKTLGGPEKSPEILKILLEHLEAVWVANPSDDSRILNDRAAKIAKALGKTDFDFTYRDTPQMKDGHTFALNELMADLAEFRGALQKRLTSGKAWQEEAQDLVKKTLKAKNIKLATCLWVGLGLTFTVPYAIRWFTHKFYHLSMYPGEIGLKVKKNPPVPVFAGTPASVPIQWPVAPYQAAMPQVVTPFALPQFPTQQRVSTPPQASSPPPVPGTAPDALEHFFPYLTRSARRGNFWPLVVSLLPLPFAAGLFDTVHHKPILPFTTKGFKQWRNLLDFGKRFPYTTQQQIAALFAFLIFSRLTSARSENEFRERTIDSFLGWAFWILATPWIQKQVSRLAGWRDKSSQLLKANGGIRTRLEIEKFLTGTVQSVTRRNHILLGAVSTVGTMALIGLLEPWLAIQWTKRNGASSL